MTDQNRPGGPTLNTEIHSQNRGTPRTLRLFDVVIFDEFVEVLGRDKARYWLEEFRKGLALEFARPIDSAPDQEKSRASIHHFCAGAGMIGFQELTEACLDFLKSGTGPAAQLAAYHRIRDQAELAFSEIDRQTAALA